MATYKVIQDIEAEDKFVGPLTLKQFVFAAGGVVFGYLNFIIIAKGGYFLLPVTLPPMLLGFFLAIPWSKDQPTEVWVLAKIKFKLKPKKKIWDQTGMQQLVTITAPKQVERPPTKGYSETEVKSRLKALAETIDSRGWVLKHATAAESQYLHNYVSDRLIDPASLPQEVPAVDLNTIPDVLDPNASSSGGNLMQMMAESDSTRKSQLIEKLNRARRGEPLDNVQPAQQNIGMDGARPDKPKAYDLDERLLAEELKQKKRASRLPHKNLHGISDGKDEKNSSKKAQATMTSDTSRDKIRLVNNNDLNIETIAREAKRSEKKDDDNEVVISLR